MKNLNIDSKYQIKKNIIITEYNENVCLSNPDIYAVKAGTIIKIIKYTHYKTSNHIVLQLKMITKRSLALNVPASPLSLK